MYKATSSAPSSVCARSSASDLHASPSAPMISTRPSSWAPAGAASTTFVEAAGGSTGAPSFLATRKPDTPHPTNAKHRTQARISRLTFPGTNPPKTYRVGFPAVTSYPSRTFTATPGLPAFEAPMRSRWALITSVAETVLAAIRRVSSAASRKQRSSAALTWRSCAARVRAPAVNAAGRRDLSRRPARRALR